VTYGLRTKCGVGYYCPPGTPAALPMVSCPEQTSSLAGASSIANCLISPVGVCDKLTDSLVNPYEEVTYIPVFSYSPLDGSTPEPISFDSGLTGGGEIQVVRKISPINETASAQLWVNDTIEAFRACPQYGSGDGLNLVTFIGRNFRDTDANFCKFRACLSANNERSPHRCRNQIQASGLDLPRIGNVSYMTIIQPAKYLSKTRMECFIPAFLFDSAFVPNVPLVLYNCSHLTNGMYSSSGNLSYVRSCDTASTYECMNMPTVGLEFFTALVLPCTTVDVTSGVCSNTPERGFLMNPCISAEVLVELTNDGEHYSGGVESGGVQLAGTSILSTARYVDGIGDQVLYNFKNSTTNATFAVYTYVYPQHMYPIDSGVYGMELHTCNTSIHAEEGTRAREEGWFQLEAHQVALMQINLTHIPSSLQYGESYDLSIFV